MGNTNVRDGGGRVPQGPPQIHGHERDTGQNIHAHSRGDASRLSHAVSSESMGRTPPESPGSSRSPLMFAPQVPMVPIQKPDEMSLSPNHTWAYSSSGCDEMSFERGIPTIIAWSYGGNEVAVEGSWDNWTSKKFLQRAGKDFAIMKVLPSGVYHYKFIVDGEWRYAPDLPWTYDEMGNVNNILDVQDYVPENLESVSGFEPPQSPDSSYNDPLPGFEDYAKEPPAVPPHLHLTLLNVPTASETPGIVPRPQHVVLNHLYVEKGRSTQSVMALGLTHRFRSKYVTVVLYQPLKK